MTNKEIDEILSGIISKYAPEFGRGISKKAALKLATSGMESKIQAINGDAYAQANAALRKCGKILEADRDNKMISGVILAGIANMNPAFVVLQIECNTVYIKASAKEGLIKQHTAEQAVKIFESAFNDADKT